MDQQDSTTSRAGAFPQQAVVDDGDYPDLRIEDDLLDSADEIAYHEDEKVYRLEYDPSVDTPSEAVVAAVAAMIRTDPMALDPLYSAIDPSVLDGLFATSPAHRRRGQIVFRYSGFEIMASTHGVIEVNPR
ncbi:HalOD1 output domain-containing protein [Halalkalicoccus ordinarius]|uniref:HalOD1 output domain-containing protein n=1 Tax=Halalkalicoccus ordinarius TaxID=3116651 RepID=UPI00300F27C0